MPPAQPQQAHQHVALSIVSTLYCSKKYIREFCTRSAAVAERLVGHDYEIVLVNDGSPDESLCIAIDLARDNPRIVVVDLSRNFGHHKAMMTGLLYSRGHQIFLMDSDLEEDSERLNNFATGELDCFDDSGALPNAIVNVNGRKLLYYTGINLGVTVKISATRSTSANGTRAKAASCACSAAP